MFAVFQCDVNRSCWPKRQDEAVKKLEGNQIDIKKNVMIHTLG